MKKSIFLILVFFIIYGICTTAYALEVDCSAEAAILYQPDSKEVLFEKNSESKHLVASTTKILTALVVLENTDPDGLVEILPEYTAIEGSSMYLKAGERFTVMELLYGLMLVSANDAAVALAEYTAGSIENFSDMMNAKAMELGCVNSHFVNPHGLDADEHYSCAYDLALIMTDAMKNPVFAEITGTKNIGFAGRELNNHNKLLWDCDGVKGGKTGYTKKAGRILVSYCTRNNMDLVCVTIADGNDWQDHISLFNWGYSEFSLVKINDSFDIPVISGVEDTVSVKCESFSILRDSESSVEIKYYIPKFLYAPVSRDTVVGKAVISYDNKETEILFYTCKDTEIDESVPLSLMEQMKWSWYYYNRYSNYIPMI